MRIEVVEFYPVSQNESKGFLSGTVRVKLPDLGIHILGIFATKRKATYYFNVPSRKGFCHITGKDTTYPVFVFEDKEKQRQFMDEIKTKGKEFIEAWLLKSDCREKQSLNEEKASDQIEAKEICKKPTEAKQITFTPKLPPQVKVREYKTPPPIKKRATAGAKAKR